LYLQINDITPDCLLDSSDDENLNNKNNNDTTDNNGETKKIIQINQTNENGKNDDNDDDDEDSRFDGLKILQQMIVGGKQCFAIASLQYFFVTSAAFRYCTTNFFSNVLFFVLCDGTA
jgi:hypothetical protein